MSDWNSQEGGENTDPVEDGRFSSYQEPNTQTGSGGYDQQGVWREFQGGVNTNTGIDVSRLATRTSQERAERARSEGNLPNESSDLVPQGSQNGSLPRNSLDSAQTRAPYNPERSPNTNNQPPTPGSDKKEPRQSIRNRISNRYNSAKQSTKDFGADAKQLALAFTKGGAYGAALSLGKTFIKKYWKVLLIIVIIQIMIFAMLVTFLFSLFTKSSGMGQNPAGSYTVAGISEQDLPFEFDKQYLMGDSFLRNTNIVSYDDIKKFLKDQNSGLLNVSPSKFGINPKTGKTETRDGAQIIYDVTQEFNINPIVVIAKLSIESSVVRQHGNESGYDDRLNSAFGYGCYDGKACKAKYAGFSKQVYYACKSLNKNLTALQSGKAANTSRKIGSTFNIDGEYIKTYSAATILFYNYTPHFAGLRDFHKILVSYCNDFGVQPIDINTQIAIPKGSKAITGPTVPRILQISKDKSKGSPVTCGITSALMVSKFYGGDVSPYVTNVNGDLVYKQSPSSSIAGVIKKLAGKDFAYISQTTAKKNKQKTIAAIRKSIDENNPVIVYSNKWYTRNQHITVIVGYNDKGFLINDPWPVGDSYKTKQAGKKGGTYDYLSFFSKLNYPDYGRALLVLNKYQSSF